MKNFIDQNYNDIAFNLFTPEEVMTRLNSAHFDFMSISLKKFLLIINPQDIDFSLQCLIEATPKILNDSKFYHWVPKILHEHIRRYGRAWAAHEVMMWPRFFNP
ncbi:MAG: hypothetical protein H0W64_11370 [Gammaproteobacteria bacterium]|nr:hypothetical protein [Gammaproteobacteria bacterium]